MMEKLPNKALLRIDEVADYFRVTDRTIRNWIDNGKLKAYKAGSGRSGILFKRDDIEKCLVRA